MKYIKRILFVYLSISCLGCNNFYQDYQQEDLWRLPLLDPYELKNIAGAKREEYENNNWQLIFQKLKVDSIASGLNITMINVDKGIIYGYGTAHPCYHFIINYNTKEEKIYKQTKEWQSELNNLGVKPDSVFDVWKLFDKFKNDRYLKWHT